MKKIDYRCFAAEQSALEYKPQLQALVNVAQAANSVPYLYQPDDAFFNTSLSDNHIKLFAFCDGELVGFAFLRLLHQWPTYFDFIPQPKDLSAMVLMNLVHPDFRGLGIGRQLLERRIEMAKQIGVKHLYVTVHPNNSVNVKLLTQIGMVTIAEREVFTEKLLRKVMYQSL